MSVRWSYRRVDNLGTNKRDETNIVLLLDKNKKKKKNALGRHGIQLL